MAPRYGCTAPNSQTLNLIVALANEVDPTFLPLEPRSTRTTYPLGMVTVCPPPPRGPVVGVDWCECWLMES